MRTQVDALLSVRRWVRSVLPGPPWRVVLAADPGRVERPYAIVATADGATGSREGPELMSMLLPIIVQAFPPSGSRPSGSKLVSERVAAALEAAVRAGVVDYADATVRGYPQRIPLWDYEGGATLDLDGLVNEDVLRDGPVGRLRPDYLLVQDGWKAQSLPEADEGQLYVATLEMRVQWFAPTGLRKTGPDLTGVGVSVGGTVP
jgi:hypothetical protein